MRDAGCGRKICDEPYSFASAFVSRPKHSGARDGIAPLRSLSGTHDWATEVLGYPIDELCLRDPQGSLDRTEFTQPAVFLVNALEYLNKIGRTTYKADIALGHSLGEYNALHAAGAFDALTALRIVERRGELMGVVEGGAMAAAIALSSPTVEQILTEDGFFHVTIANYNAPTQNVIAGPKSEIERAGAIFEKAGASYRVLRVSAAFHSASIQAVRERFAAFIATIELLEIRIPVISNLHARPYGQQGPVRVVEAV
jgi:trans-AT polyketide synthase, acyltransferase and oxidoreductase domains